MSRLNIPNIREGHRVEGPSNRDLEQKLTYQQLLNFNHDLSKENQQLKNIANRLGQELRNLHSQFDIRPRQENNDLYTAINSQPILHNYQLTLIPLFQAYQAKIQEFESGFETFNEEFINLEKKYIEVAAENQRLRADLTDRTKELVEVYRTGSSQKLGADFSQIILAQINEKQRFLSQENTRLQKQYQRYKSEGDKSARELTDCKRREQQVSAKLRQLELSHRQLEAENKSLKEKVFEEQMRINGLEGEKKKLDNDLQRAMSQVSQLNKDRDALLRNYETLKTRFQKYVAQLEQNSDPNAYNPGRSALEQTSTQLNTDDTLKKLTKLQKEYDNVFRDRNKIKEELEQLRVSLEQANQRFSEAKRKLQDSEQEKRKIEMSEIKSKKLMEQLTEKGKTDVERVKRQQEEEVKRIEDEYYNKIKETQRKNQEIEQALEKVTLERDKLEQENIINTSLAKDANKVGSSKETQRAVDKLKEKLSINEQLFKEQLQIVQNDNVYLKRESDNLKNDNKDKAEEIRKLKQQLQKIRRELIEVEERHTITIEEIKRVRNEYEGNLRDKERLFDQKIKEIKTVVEESDKRRKSDKQKIAESTRQYKRVLQQIKDTYEERIRVLENQGSGYNSKVRKIEGY